MNWKRILVAGTGLAAFTFGMLFGAITYTPSFPNSATPLPTLTRQTVTAETATPRPEVTSAQPTIKHQKKAVEPRPAKPKSKKAKKSQTFEMRLEENVDSQTLPESPPSVSGEN